MKLSHRSPLTVACSSYSEIQMNIKLWRNYSLKTLMAQKGSCLFLEEARGMWGPLVDAALLEMHGSIERRDPVTGEVN
jgi:hypothetical protein